MSLLLLLGGAEAGAPAPTTPAARVTNEPLDDSLYAELLHADGRPSRWSGEEPDASGIPIGIKTSTSAPGGHRDASLTLRRDPRVTWPDLNLVDEIRIRGRTSPMGRSVFEGETSFFPSQLGGDTSISVNASGNQIQLTDNENFAALYVKQGFEGWAEQSLARRQFLSEHSVSSGKIPFSNSTGGLVWDLPVQNLVGGDNGEAVIAMPAALRIAKVGYRGTRRGDWSKMEAPKAFGGDTEGYPENESVSLTLDGTARVASFASARRYAMLRAWTVTEGQGSAGAQQTIDRLALYGATGVPLVGGTSTELPGVYAHDALAHMVTTGAPGLNCTIGGSIVPNTNFVIPDLWFGGGTVMAAVEKANAYFLNNWGVFDDKTFFWRPWDPERLTWKASVAGGAQWSPAGRQAQTLLNGVVLRYTDAEGVARTAGPVGSGCDYESPLLSDPDPNNPYTRRGRHRWGELTVSFPLAFPTAAFQLGAAFMADHLTPQRSGTLRIRPTARGHIPQIQHPTMGALPIWSVWAGDYIELSDWPEPEPFRVITTEYDHDSKTLTAQLETAAARVSAILERAGVKLTGIA